MNLMPSFVNKVSYASIAIEVVIGGNGFAIFFVVFSVVVGETMKANNSIEALEVFFE